MKILKIIYNLSIKDIYKYFRRKIVFSKFDLNDLKNIESLPRFANYKIPFLGKNIEIIDSKSFIFMFKEIFEKEIYKFNNSKAPIIIDCGANIGLSVIYFKSKIPDSKIIAFEPDPKIFKVLKNNIESFGYNNINLVNKALWSYEGEIDFTPDNADGGSIINVNAKKIHKVKTTILSNYIIQKIDFLKIDIEGAEFEVLYEIRNKLNLIERLFIEYHSFANKKQQLSDLLDILIINNFRIFINSPGFNVRQPFIDSKKENGMDMQLNIYAYKI